MQDKLASLENTVTQIIKREIKEQEVNIKKTENDMLLNKAAETKQKPTKRKLDKRVKK